MPPPAAAPRAAVPATRAANLDAYKKEVASRIASRSGDLFSDPLPDMLKSVVVLEIRIDRDGRLANVAVRRSNGYRALENRAMDSVRRAAPFDAPSLLVRRGEGSVTFLETFLFRDDGRFQIRSLVASR
ncbi:MAG: TonB family protein [Betaproteobacteria bacterium]|nr:TonB family protein [Betaproteobacteria bacterium]